MHDLLSQFEDINILKKSGKVNSNWRRLITPSLTAALKFEFERLNVGTISEVVWCLKNKQERPKCPTCEKYTKFLSYGYYRTYCSAKCAAVNDNTKTKRETTNIKKYGVANVAQSVQVSNKQKHSAHKAFTDKMLTAISDKFTTDVSLLDSFNKFDFTCSTCGTKAPWRVFSKRIPRCYKCQPHTQSGIHVKIRELLETINVHFLEHDRNVIKPLELDFFIPSLQLAIEVNGIYWHSEENNHGKESHRYKTLRCLQEKITLIHLFEDDIVLNFESIKSRLIENYFQATDCDIEIKEMLEVDGSWPLPQWFSAEVVDISEPRLRKIDPRFSKQPLRVWDSGSLFYRST